MHFHAVYSALLPCSYQVMYTSQNDMLLVMAKFFHANIERLEAFMILTAASLVYPGCH